MKQDKKNEIYKLYILLGKSFVSLAFSTRHPSKNWGFGNRMKRMLLIIFDVKCLMLDVQVFYFFSGYSFQSWGFGKRRKEKERK
ncbi:MAG: hypothetical protein HGGPFJEG_01963 [Ignavibacteria bacterium]|nr:hypothetical protein [Ignavibacteria bacterium]